MNDHAYELNNLLVNEAVFFFSSNQFRQMEFYRTHCWRTVRSSQRFEQIVSVIRRLTPRTNMDELWIGYIESHR